MKVSVIGTGYVGLVSGTCFAEMGHNVTCIDVDEKKIRMLCDGKSPIYEPGLNEMLARNIHSKRLFFATDYTSISDSRVVFLAVGTPATPEGPADLSALFQAATEVAKNLNEHDSTIVVIKSTVPIGTAFKVKKHIASLTNRKFCIVNNPEFLKEGSAINDFMRPDRVIVGYERSSGEKEGEIMEELYAPLVRQGNPIYHMSNLSAEMTKYAANCFLATKISFINDIARLCDATGADIEEVRKGITSDKRIGPHFLYPGPGYGGSCFPKDVQALMSTAAELDMPLKIVRAAWEINLEQKRYLFIKLIKHFNGDLKGKTFAFWGVSFKPNTDDIREAPSITILEEIVNAGGKVHIYDPVATENFIAHIKEMAEESNAPELLASVKVFDNKYDCLNGSDALLVITDWPEFKAPDFLEIRKRLRLPVLIDGRNLYPTNRVLEYGLQYYAVGKHIPSTVSVSSAGHELHDHEMLAPQSQGSHNAINGKHRKVDRENWPTTADFQA